MDATLPLTKQRIAPASLTIRLLSESDAAGLLEFERVNRIWFEQFLPPRPDSWFCASRIKAHIRFYLSAFEQGELHPCILQDHSGTILGRANLRDIHHTSGSATIGYRIAQSHSGLGLASAATAHLIALARTEWKLQRLNGYASVSNHASARVLTKSGFIRTRCIPGMAVLRNTTMDCDEYILSV